MPISVKKLKDVRTTVMSPVSNGSIILSACSSPSMMFSQTNQDRMTLQSVIQAQETNKKLQ